MILSVIKDAIAFDVLKGHTRLKERKGKG